MLFYTDMTSTNSVGVLLLYTYRESINKLTPSLNPSFVLLDIFYLL